MSLPFSGSFREFERELRTFRPEGESYDHMRQMPEQTDLFGNLVQDDEDQRE